MANYNRDKNELLQASIQVREEQGDSQNSANRIGQLFYDITQHLDEGGSSYPSPTGNDTYLHWNGSDYNWTKPSGGTASLNGFLNSLNSFTQPTSVQTGYLHYNGNSGQLEWTDIPSGSGITEAQMWTSLVSKAKWWGRNLTKITDNDYQVKGSLSGDIDFIEFKNGVKLGIDTQNNNTLKVFRDDSAQANFYATGGVSALGYDASGGGGGGGGLTSGSWAEYLNGKQKSGSDPEASKYLHLKSDGTVEWADGGGGSFEPNDLVESLNTKSGMPSEGQILVYRPDTLGGWSYEAKPTTGGEGGIDNIIFNGTEATLSNKTATIAQEKADWNANSGYAEILNKPTALRQFTDDLGDSPAHTHSQYAIASEMTTALDTKLNASEFNSFKTDTTWWGQHIGDVTAGKVEGDIEAGAAGGAITGFHSLELNTHNTAYQGIGGFIDFHVGGQQQGVPDYTARLIEDPLGILCVQSMTKEEKFQKAGLHVGQNFKDSFVQIGNVKLVYDGDSAIRVEKSDGTAAHFYATGGVSALGIQPEVTGLESFTISNLKSSQITLQGTNGSSFISGKQYGDLEIKAEGSSIRFTVDSSVSSAVAAEISDDGVTASLAVTSPKFYFDNVHHLCIRDGELTYYDGNNYRKVNLT